jgi:16S rRNA processing protein RimM
MERDEPAIVVGAITKAHGLRGEVAVEVRSDNPDRFGPGATMFLPDGARLTVDRSHPHGTRMLVKFEEVSGRSEADALRGQLLSVPKSWLPELPEGEYWPFQLEGCDVVTESGRSLGRVTEVIPNPANDLWVALDAEGTETLVPAIHDVVVRVDVGGGRIVVRDVPGLTAPEDPAAG